MDLQLLEDALGKITEWEQLCPGVWYISAGSREYYAVTETAPAISPEARAYGQKLEYCSELLYPLDKPDSGWMIVRYEICKYLTKTGGILLEGITLQDAAIFGMECHPEYFGTFPAPSDTSLGGTLR